MDSPHPHFKVSSNPSKRRATRGMNHTSSHNLHTTYEEEKNKLISFFGTDADCRNLNTSSRARICVCKSPAILGRDLRRSL